MHFYKKFIRTFNDLPNHTTLLIHSLVGCKFKCFGCHNYDEIIANKPKDYYTDVDVIVHFVQNGYLFDAVIFSGGEFLMEDLDEICDLFQEMREVFKGKIIINTNGNYPHKIQYLLENKIVDGIHVDMKLPYHLLDVNEDKDIYQAIMGITPNQVFIDKLLESIDIVIKFNTDYSQVRTVKYPILSQEFFDEIKIYIESLNNKYGSNVSYYLNDFMNIDI